MLFVKPLNTEEIQNLSEMYKTYATHTSRQRAHAILLSHEQFELSQIALICGTCRQTVSTWLHAWENNGIEGLYDKPRSGRPRKLNSTEDDFAIDQVKASPRSLKKTLQS